MSFSISPNESGVPRAKNSAVKPSSRASFIPTRSASTNAINTNQPSFSGDQVRFGNRGAKAEGVKPVAEPEAPHTSDQTNKPGEKSQRTYGHKENNIREAARIVLCDIAPLALSVLPLVGIPGVGFVFAVATLPMSYMSGKLGRHVAKDVNTDDLNPAFQYIHKVKHALTQSHGKNGPNGKDGNVVDSINKATNDLLNVRNMPAIFTSTLLPMLKVKQGSWAAKALTKMNSVALMRAEVNIRLAQAENGKDAGKAMFNGVKDFALYSAMNKMGTAMVASSLPGAKWAGEFLKNAAWVKIAADLLHSREAEKKPAPA